MNDYKEIIVKEYHNEKGLITRREIGEEIVRCGDCIHYAGCSFFGKNIDDYCSRGERKEQEHE